MSMDKHDFEAVLRETHPYVRAHIAGLGVPSDSVDDVAQDVYVDFYGLLDRLSDEVEPLPYLKNMARKRVLNFFRQRKRIQQRQFIAITETLHQTHSDLESPPTAHRPVRDALADCLEQVTGRARELVELRYHQEQPSIQIATCLGMSETAVRVALSRVRDKLRECIKLRIKK